jgi:hypothetical protein
MTGSDGFKDMGAEQDGESSASLLEWLNANGIYIAPKELPAPVIHIHIKNVILANDKAIIGEVRKLIMGDHFEKIGTGVTIVNRSMLINSLNRVQRDVGEPVARALQMAAQVVEESGNQEAIENFNALSEELDRAQPRKAVIKSFWNGIIAALPGIAEMVGIADHISQLFK